MTKDEQQREGLPKKVEVEPESARTNARSHWLNDAIHKGGTLVGLMCPTLPEDEIPTVVDPTRAETGARDSDAHPWWGSEKDTVCASIANDFESVAVLAQQHSRTPQSIEKRRHPGRRKDDTVPLFSARLRRTSGFPSLLIGAGLAVCGGVAFLLTIVFALGAVLTNPS